MRKIPDRDPVFPGDFRVVSIGTKHSFWVWSPDPTRSFPCLTVDCGGLASDTLQHGGVATVAWEYAQDTESGPFRDRIPVAPGLSDVQQAIADVMREVREEYEVLREDLLKRRSFDLMREIQEDRDKMKSFRTKDE